MPYVSPTTQVTLTTAPVSWANSVKTATDYLSDPPACRVYNNAGLTHTSTGNWQALSGLNSERYDTDNMHSTVTNTGRITFNTAGVYVVGGCLDWAANVTGVRGIQIYLNGTTEIVTQYNNANSAFGTGLNCCTAYKFAVNDFIEIRAFQSSGGNLAINSSPNSSPEFHAHWVGLG